MKNLMIFVNPNKSFWSQESLLMIKTNIDNSLELGYNIKDIIVATNFPFEYAGVEALVVPDSCICDYWLQVSKINVICWLFENNKIEDDIYWFHDLDAFEAHKINYNLPSNIDAAFTDYGYRYRHWNTGSFFFNNNAADIFKLIKERCYEIKTNEEKALDHLTINNINNINSRIEKVNITYNYPGSNNGYKYFEMVYERCDLPVKVLHFHPLRWGGRFFRMFDGGNPLSVNLIPDRLINILNKYGATGARPKKWIKKYGHT